MKELKGKKFSCPILITTASNKWKSYKEINRLGALAYWQKKGLDEQNDMKSLLENYFSFLKLIYVLCKDKTIAFLYNDFFSMIRELGENKEIYWWETAFWRNAEKTINKSKKIEIENDEITANSGKTKEILHKSYFKRETQEERTYGVSKKEILRNFRESWELYLGFVSEKILYDDFQLENSAKDDIISVKKKNNAIIVVYLFNILESIYKIRESDISMYNRLLYLTNTRDIQMDEIKKWMEEITPKIAPKKQQDPDISIIDTLLSYIGIITNRRNIATHQLDCNKKDLHSFIKGLFLFLKNDNLCFYEEKDRLKPKNNDTEITPMPQ